jgi:hypothetical protein
VRLFDGFGSYEARLKDAGLALNRESKAIPKIAQTTSDNFEFLLYAKRRTIHCYRLDKNEEPAN